MTNSADPNEDCESFWDFSLRIYKFSKVSQSCMSLQERYHLDVNLLLFCYWYGVTRGVMGAALLNRALEFSDSWSTQVVRPLRQSRTWMKGYNREGDNIDTKNLIQLRKNIKQVELNAEKHQQIILESLANMRARPLSADQRRTAISNNLRTYASAISVQIDENCAELFARIESYALNTN